MDANARRRRQWAAERLGCAWADGVPLRRTPRPADEEELRQALRRCRQILICVLCEHAVDTTNAVCVSRDGSLAHGGCLRDELEAAEGK